MSLPQTTAILVANLHTAEPYAAFFEAELHTDTSGTNRVGKKSEPVSGPAGGPYTQTKAMIFPGAIVGTTYYLRARVVDRRGRASPWSEWVAEVAGDATPPDPTYAPAASSGLGGLIVNSNPSGAAADTARYEVFWNRSGSAPSASTRPNHPGSPDGQNLFFSTDVNETAHIWIRAVDTSGNRQSWVSLGAFSARRPELDSDVTDGVVFIRGTSHTSAVTLDNPDFEASDLLPPPGWASAQGGTAAYLTVSPYSGQRSLLLSATAGSGASLTALRRWAVRPGQRFRLSAALRRVTGSETDVTAAVEILWLDASGSPLETPLAITSTSASFELKTALGTVPSGAVSAALRCRAIRHAGSVQAAFDSLRVVLVSTAAEVIRDLAAGDSLLDIVQNISGNGLTAKPTAILDADPLVGDAPLVVDFSSANSLPVPPGTIVGRIWDFGDGSPLSIVADPQHTYSTPGFFTARLYVLGSEGSIGFTSKTIAVEDGGSPPPGDEPPVADLQASPTSGENPLLVDFDASGSTAGTNPIDTYQFDFGDGNASNPQSSPFIQHTYTSVGQFLPSVTVKDTASLQDSAYGPQITVTPGGPE